MISMRGGLIRPPPRLPALVHGLFDVIGPRLVGSPGMMKAHEWVVETYRSWGMNDLRDR